MNTFEADLLGGDWLEILAGGEFVAFDKLESTRVEVLFTETADTPNPATSGNNVETWPSSFDFEASGMAAGVQRVWVKGTGKIRGVRG